MTERRPLNQKTGWSSPTVLATGVGGFLPSVQATFDDPGHYTIQFEVVAPKGLFYLAQARVSWSVEGNNAVRIVNVGSGVSVSGVGQAVGVQIMDATTPDMITLVGQTPGTEYTISAQVIKGLRANYSSPPTLILLDPRPTGGGITNGNPSIVVTNIADVTVPIPANSGATAIFPHAFKTSPTAESPANGDGKIDVFAATGVPLMTIDASDTDSWIPLPPGANFCILHTAIAATIQWNIALGIDG